MPYQRDSFPEDVFCLHKYEPSGIYQSDQDQKCLRISEKTDDSIGVIAAKCGFTTNSTFNRNFRHLLGVTPMEWRKRPENYEQELLKFEIHSEKGW